MSTQDQKLKEFVDELSGFAITAEEVLKKIESDKHGNKNEFNKFSQWMLTIRGTALQLGFKRVAEVAGLGEEIALKGTTAETGGQIRKCIGSLWDTLTSVKWLIQHPSGESTEEMDILVNRLQSTLKAFGGAREAFTPDDIEKLLSGKK